MAAFSYQPDTTDAWAEECGVNGDGCPKCGGRCSLGECAVFDMPVLVPASEEVDGLWDNDDDNLPRVTVAQTCYTGNHRGCISCQSPEGDVHELWCELGLAQQ